MGILTGGGNQKEYQRSVIATFSPQVSEVLNIENGNVAHNWLSHTSIETSTFGGTNLDFDNMSDDEMLDPNVLRLMTNMQLHSSAIPNEQRDLILSIGNGDDSVDENGEISEQGILAPILDAIVHINNTLLSLIPGIPNHKFTLKVGCPAMLLRNIGQAVGLCNKTKITITHLGKNFLGETVITGKTADEKNSNSKNEYGSE
uniref:Uncharacterized protein LOC105851448 n=1 Tax=Cicer arietinum TaxID=3827 RepID=A0A1S3DY44_CICAR|nr:uncharacterized protein LOC105851448 [Cicer arietinum]